MTTITTTISTVVCDRHSRNSEKLTGIESFEEFRSLILAAVVVVVVAEAIARKFVGQH